ncbi:hypothetical protein D1BOALGB6SA_1139 [Olavius sp. associated proteobacterium Delta 1]|nr:hypothetical protein D1BOALGB6SA_1139 [Olavius sp. associated proteobacterium Delta 1]
MFLKLKKLGKLTRRRLNYFMLRIFYLFYSFEGGVINQ